MKISIITPTGGRPLAFKLCELWIKRQTLQPDEWIVVDDYEIPTKYTMGQKIIRREPFWQPNQMTLQKNLLEALKFVTGDIILIIEDDDWYNPDYIKNMVKKFQILSKDKPIGNSSLIIGEAISLYYNVKNYTYHYFNNIHYASLFQTGFTKDLIPQINDLLVRHQDQLYFDLYLWKELKDCDKIMFLTKSPWSIGMKGLRGKRTAWTFGHDKELPFLDEKCFYLLEKIMGENDTSIYMHISEYLYIKECNRIDKILLQEIQQVDQNLNELSKKV